MPRKRTTNSSAFVQLKNEIRNIKAEMNPSITTFRPAAQPSPIKDGVEGRWSYARFRVTRPAIPAGGTSNVTAGNLAASIGLSKVDFQVDRLACWLMGSPDYQGGELALTPAGTVPATVSFTQRDYGTVNRPPAIGMNIPRTLGVIQNGVTSATTTVITTADYDGTGLTTSAPATLVFDFWVLYRQSA